MNHRQGIEVDRASFYIARPEFFPLFKLKLSAAYKIRLWWEIQLRVSALGQMQLTILLFHSIILYKILIQSSLFKLLN
jgi:hypothetical protein